MPPLPREELERILKALGNVSRIALLEALQRPQRYADLELSPHRRDDLNPDRPMSRQGVLRHLKELIELGVVDETPGQDGFSTFVVNHARLFAVVEQLRQIATVKPTIEPGGETMAIEGPSQGVPVDGAHLVLVRGVREGQAFRLAPPRREWSVGRSRSASICLDYDPYVSGEHARIVRRDGGFFLADLESSRNGTHLNWQRMTKGGVAPLRSGDVIGVGMSLLVFRD